MELSIMNKGMERDYCLTFIERTTIYTFLKVAFEGPLTEETLNLWKETFSDEFIKLLTDGNQDLADFFAELKNSDLDIMEQLEKDAYLATFNLLNDRGRIPAPPWESVYVTRDQTMFGDPVFQLRNQLNYFGLKFTDENREPEDHIAVELEFMCYLNNYTHKAIITGNEESYLKGIYTQYWLHKEHFNHWIQAFTNDILASNTSHFYKGLAELLRAFVSEDFNYMKSLKEDLDNG